ncbi:MAG: ABC transporter substrate-binding protein [Bacteroidetes bacterium]|nr:ABC transporter substrate-binding protein [Bacteroidota bacterium]
MYDHPGKVLISPEDTLWQIAERYPETIAVFVRHGFSLMADPEKRLAFGSKLRLDIALGMRQIDFEVFYSELEAAVMNSGRQPEYGPGVVRVKGLLPCPVRLPLQEKLDTFVASRQADGLVLAGELKAASMGLDWLKSDAEAAASPSELDDIYLSAGFDLFFEERYFGRFIKSGHFVDPTGWDRPNPCFPQAGVDILDPLRRYGVVAVVPAVFLVNTAELAGRPVPSSWEDLLHPQWEASLSLPVSDFDLFNAILLTISNKYGMDAVEALGRNMQQSLHPAQMVKSERLSRRPAVTIMPNFFTKMARPGGPMLAVWPADGAILSPVFMIAKSDGNSHIGDVASLLASREVGEILSHLGLFPSVHPLVDNRLPAGAPMMWLGWDFIGSNDLNTAFEACNERFKSATTY